jgi:hypothetical protein
MKALESAGSTAPLPEGPWLALSNERFELELEDIDFIEVTPGAQEEFIVPIKVCPARVALLSYTAFEPLLTVALALD